MNLQLLAQGGVVMILILICSVVALAVFIERFIHLHRARINADDFMHGIRNAISRGRYKEALEACESVPGPVAMVIRTVIENRRQDRPEIQSLLEEAAQLEIPRMERRVAWLATIGAIAPVLGLLGTVLGLMESFQEMQRIGAAVSVSNLAAGVWKALITAAAGLTVSIPCLLAHNYLVGRIRDIVYDMERVSLELVTHFTSKPDNVISLEEQEEKAVAAKVVELPEAAKTAGKKDKSEK